LTRIVFVTQQFDPDDPNLGLVVAQVEAIARRVDEVVVVADRVVASALPTNARGRSFAARTQVGRGARLLAAVAPELPGLRRGGAVIAHQIPLYAIVLAPLVRPARVPLVLWWSHWKLDAVVRTAEAVSSVVVSVGPTTFPKPSRKLVTVGQAIDVDRFAGERVEHAGPLRAVVIGRYSPAKGVETILRAAKLTGAVRVDVYGPAPNDGARRERESLERLVDELGLRERVELHGPLTRGEVVDVLRNADVLVNNAPGGADRIVYEAAAGGVPVLASNPAHSDLLDAEAFYARADPTELAEKLTALASADRAAIGSRLRERVRRDHSVDSWAERVLAAALPRLSAAGSRASPDAQ
jgi:glycosyltransferase involved in cell wall biosynthesis